jgi:hypothetical protein
VVVAVVGLQTQDIRAHYIDVQVQVVDLAIITGEVVNLLDAANSIR